MRELVESKIKDLKLKISELIEELEASDHSHHKQHNIQQQLNKLKDELESYEKMTNILIDEKSK